MSARRAGTLGALALAAIAPGTAGGATLPGWSPGAIAFAGGEVVVTQIGPVSSGRLTYHRTDVWRVRLAPRGAAGPARRVITVRTSAGPMRVGPLAGNPDGTFTLVAPGETVGGPVIWCCDPTTGLQDVLESDGRPDARRPLAAASGPSDGGLAHDTLRGPVRIGSPTTSWLVRTADAMGLVTRGPLDRSERWLPSVPARDLVAIGSGLVAWVEGPPYNAGERLRVQVTGSAPPGAAPPGTVASTIGVPWPSTVDLPGRAEAVWVVPGSRPHVAALSRGASGWAIVKSYGSGGRAVWRTRVRPVAAAGGDRLVMAAGGRLFLWGTGSPRDLGPFRRPLRSLATDGRRIAWTEWERVGGRRRTVVRWRSLSV